MAFTDKELAVLAQLAYKEVDFRNSYEISLNLHITDNVSYLREKLGQSYYDTIEDLIAKTNDCTIVKAVNDKDDTGFAAFAVKDSNNEITIACRGTEDLKKDGVTDLQIGLAKETNQHQKMEVLEN